MLVQKGIITEEQLSEALKQQKEKKLMLGEMIVSMGFASQSQINDVLCEHLNIDFVDMREEDVYKRQVIMMSYMGVFHAKNRSVEV